MTTILLCVAAFTADFPAGKPAELPRVVTVMGETKDVIEVRPGDVLRWSPFETLDDDREVSTEWTRGKSLSSLGFLDFPAGERVSQFWLVQPASGAQIEITWGVKDEAGKILRTATLKIRIAGGST